MKNTFFFPSSRCFSTINNKNTPPLLRLSENEKHNSSLHQITKFPYANSQRKATIKVATLSFRFRSIAFDKKRALPFFLAVELLTQQKAVATLARRHLLA